MRRARRRSCRIPSCPGSSVAGRRASHVRGHDPRRGGRRAGASRIRGGGTKDFYGQALDGEVLDTRAYAGIVDYEPTELVITVARGTPLAEIERVLAERRQMLAFEPPHFGSWRVPRRSAARSPRGCRDRAGAAAGAVRDFVLGVRLMDGRGEDLAFGGRVMKNVAGYDVSRLMAGALGTLGVILEVSLKVLPAAGRGSDAAGSRCRATRRSRR